jgi:Pyruvate/2-oxoacid:ferredoxin oxidoreductase delta subunit
MTDEMEIYRELADMYLKEDVVGAPESPAFLKLLGLQYTMAEAHLALQVRFQGKKLDAIAEVCGIKKEKLKPMLTTMSDKGTIHYEVSSDDPTYRVATMAAPGITETGLWGNIKFPYSVELAKTLHTVLKEWSEQKLSALGFPFAPVWAGVKALPKETAPEENLLEAIKNEGHWSVSPCPCRLSHWIADPGNHCDHILEACLHTGELSKWAVKHGLARELSWEDTVKCLEDCNENGLVHTINIQNCICNCCNDCCTIFHGHKLGHEAFIPSPFIPEVDVEACQGCDTCADRCPVEAIEVDETASVNYDKCIGCGVCVPACTTDSMQLVRRTG